MDKAKHYYMNAAELMDEVLEVYKNSFFKQLAFSLIMSAISSAIIFVFAFIGVFAVLMAFFSGGNDLSTGDIIIIIAVVAGFIIFFGCLSAAIRSTGNIIISKEAFTGEDTGLGKIIGISVRKMLPVATVVFAEIILMIPLFLVWGGLLAGFFIVTEAMVDTAGAGALAFVVVSGLLIGLFIVLTLIVFSAFTIIAVPIAIFEKKYFFSAITKGFRLIKKDFWRILGVVAIWFVVVEVISYGILALTGLGGTLVGFVAPTDVAEMIEILSVGSNYLFSASVSVILTPLGGIFSALMYINQKMKYEGYDIELGIDRLERQAQQALARPHIQYRS